MLTKDYTLRVKALEDSGAFEGIGSPYGEPADLQNDIIQPGVRAGLKQPQKRRF